MLGDLLVGALFPEIQGVSGQPKQICLVIRRKGVGWVPGWWEAMGIEPSARPVQRLPSYLSINFLWYYNVFSCLTQFSYDFCLPCEVLTCTGAQPSPGFLMHMCGVVGPLLCDQVLHFPSTWLTLNSLVDWPVTVFAVGSSVFVGTAYMSCLLCSLSVIDFEKPLNEAFHVLEKPMYENAGRT